MAANWELQLISAILEDGDLDTPERGFRIESSCFISPEAASVYDGISRYWHNRKHYGETPPFEWVEEKYPTVDLPEATATIEELCDIVQKNYTRRKILDFSDQLYDVAKNCEDPDDAVDFLLTQTKELTRVLIPGEDIDFGETALSAMQNEVQLLEDAGGLIGHPWPWQVMNDATQGLENGGLYIFYGRPGSMKTWLMLYMATNLYVNCNLRALVWCREMRPEQIRRRIAMIVGEIDYAKFRNGSMSPGEKARLFEYLEMLREEERGGGEQRLRITKGSFSDKESATGSFAELRSSAEDFQPQVIFCDSPYHMQRSAKWRDIMTLARDLKSLAMDLNVPVVVTWQANREGDKSHGKSLSEVAMGDSLGMEADMVCRILKRKREGLTKLSLVFPKGREFEFEGFTINGEPASDFGWYSNQVLWEEEEEEQAHTKGGGGSTKGAALRGMSPEPVDEQV